jgi:hypothetical protein
VTSPNKAKSQTREKSTAGEEMEMRRAAYCRVWLLLLVVAALALSLAAAHQPPRQVKGTPSAAAKSSPPPASRAKGAGRARSAYDEDEEPEGFVKEADDETARARVVRKSTHPTYTHTHVVAVVQDSQGTLDPPRP